MKNLLVAAPMLILASALLAPSCSTGDQGGVTGVGGSGPGHVGTGGSAQGTGGSAQGTGGMITGTGGAVDAGGADRSMGTGGAGVGGMIDAGGDMGGGGGIADVAKVLDGFMLLGPCIRDTAASVCATVNGACPGANTAGSGLAGVLTTDKTVTLGGTPGTMYSITLHIQGEVESKQYGGMDANNTLASPAANGFCIGGTPTNADAYNVYLIKVTSGGVGDQLLPQLAASTGCLKPHDLWYGLHRRHQGSRWLHDPVARGRFELQHDQELRAHSERWDRLQRPDHFEQHRADRQDAQPDLQLHHGVQRTVDRDDREGSNLSLIWTGLGQASVSADDASPPTASPSPKHDALQAQGCPVDGESGRGLPGRECRDSGIAIV